MLFLQRSKIPTWCFTYVLNSSSGDLAPSYGLLRHQTCTEWTYIYTGKTFTTIMDREIEILSVWNVYSSYFFSRLNGRFITEHRAQHLSREPQMGMYLTPQTSGMSCFSVTISSNSSALNLKSHFCGMWIFWQPGNLALYSEPQLHVPYFAAWYEWTWQAGQCEPWCHCALGLHKGTIHTSLKHISPSTGQHLVDWDDIERVESHYKMKASTTLYHVLAQIQAVSRT